MNRRTELWRGQCRFAACWLGPDAHKCARRWAGRIPLPAVPVCLPGTAAHAAAAAHRGEALGLLPHSLPLHCSGPPAAEQQLLCLYMICCGRLYRHAVVLKWCIRPGWQHSQNASNIISQNLYSVICSWAFSEMRAAPSQQLGNAWQWACIYIPHIQKWTAWAQLILQLSHALHRCKRR